jgi:hypothetical protein
MTLDDVALAFSVRKHVASAIEHRKARRVDKARCSPVRFISRPLSLHTCAA